MVNELKRVQYNNLKGYLVSNIWAAHTVWYCISTVCMFIWILWDSPFKYEEKTFFLLSIIAVWSTLATVRLYMYLSSSIRGLLQPLMVGSQGYIFLIPLWWHGISGYYTVCHIASVCRQCRLLTLESFIDFRVNKWHQSHILTSESFINLTVESIIDLRVNY